VGALAPSPGYGAPITPSFAGAVAPASAVQATPAKVRSIGMVVGLGIITFGIYWVVALYGALKDFDSIRRRNDINPILFLIPILGLLELLKLPQKVEETRAAIGVSNPVAPNLVLYILFPQIFFIADLNEIVEASARRTSIS
jgi:cytosine/uracil/thiamine/allantoin permease